MKYRSQLPARTEGQRWQDRRWFPYLLTALAATAVFLAMMICCRLYPFGDRALASSDGKNQYLSFYHYFRSILFSQNNIDYSFSTVLGGNIRGLYAYYLASPLYVLFALFPEDQILLGLHTVIYLKYLLAALGFCAWAGYRKEGNPWLRAALSVSYGFMGYAVTFYSLLSWLDAMVLLPLVALGLERLVAEHKPAVYIVTLTITITANYYTGFMVCVASVLIYAALVFAHADGAAKVFKRTAVPFGAASLLAGGLSAWCLLPTVLSLPGDRMEESQSVFASMGVNFPFMDFFSKLFTGATSADQFYNGLPTVFVGIIPLVLAVLFFLNPGIRRRWKVVAAAALLTMLFSFHNTLLNTVWHGFTINRMFNYRYSFVFSFLLLAVAWHSVRRWESLTAGTICRCLALCLAAVMLIFSRNYPYGNAKTLYFDLAMLASGIGLVYLMTRGRRAVAAAMLCLMAVNVLANGVLSVNSIYARFGSALQSTHYGYLDEARDAMALMEDEGEFFRIEKTYCRTYTDNMALDLPGITNFSSVERQEPLRFLWNLGINRYTAWAQYTGESPTASESLLGVRYVMAKEPLSVGREQYPMVGQTEEQVSVYRNPYALPVLLPAGELMTDLSGLEGCDFQNACWRSIAPDADGDVLRPATRVDVQMEPGGTACRLTYQMPVSGGVYFQFPGVYTKKEWPYELGVCWGQEVQSVELTRYRPIYLLGEFDVGQTVTVELRSTDGKKIAPEQFRVYAEDLDALAAYSRRVQSTPMTIRKVTSSRLTAQCQVGEQTPYLVSTIPYDRGWAVSVDGERVQTVENWDCMLAFAIEPGEHTVELRYRLPGKLPGVLISLVAAWATVIWVIPRSGSTGKPGRSSTKNQNRRK